MPVFDFREIPIPSSGASRDQFELFAREFMEMEGFKVLSGPDRGPDLGRDLLLEETRIGPGGETKLRWLVSCKHKAHSGNAVSVDDEQNIRDRLKHHKCSGFVAFYSTIPSSSLSAMIDGLRDEFEVIRYDSERIEVKLLGTRQGQELARRFMPMAYTRWANSVAPPPASVSVVSQHSGFFLSEPFVTLSAAQARAIELGKWLFIVIFDELHPTKSKMTYLLSNFLEFNTTKRLVDEYFVSAIVPSSGPGVAELIPDSDPLEECLLVVMDNEGNIYRQESVYANPNVGMQRVRDIVATMVAK